MKLCFQSRRLKSSCMKRVQNEQGMLALVVIFSLAAMAACMAIWMGLSSTQSQYRKLKSANELKVVNQLILSAVKAELMRKPVRPAFPSDDAGVNLANFRDLSKLAKDLNYIPKESEEVHGSCAGYTYDPAKWALNVLCLSGVGLNLENIGKISLKVSAREDLTGTNPSTRPILIEIISHTKPGIFSSSATLSRDFSLSLAVGNQFGIVLTDTEDRIKISGLSTAAVDPKEIILGNAPGVVFDSKMLINANGALDLNALPQTGVVYSHLYTTARSVKDSGSAHFPLDQHAFMNGIETNMFNTAESGFDYLSNLFTGSNSTGQFAGLNEKIFSTSYTDVKQSVSFSNTDASEVACSLPNGTTPQSAPSSPKVFPEGGDLNATCAKGAVVVAQEYGIGNVKITYRNDDHYTLFCGLVAANTVEIELPTYDPTAAQQTFAFVGTIIARNITIKFDGCSSNCMQRLFFLNPYDHSDLPSGLSFTDNSMAKLAGDFVDRSMTVSRRFVSPALLAGTTDLASLNQYVKIHGWGDVSDTTVKPYMDTSQPTCSQLQRTCDGTNNARCGYGPFNYKSEANSANDIFGFNLEGGHQ